MKFLITFFIVMFTSISYAQDWRLFENQWYLTNLVINGNNNIPPFNDMGISFEYKNFYTEVNDGCNSLMGFTDLPTFTSTQFTYSVMEQTLLVCADRITFEQLYFGFFSENNTLTNEFNYSISESGNVKTLVINSMLNNQAIYSTQMLSTSQNRKLNFSVYPNPVKDYINIKFEDLKTKDAKIEIYNSLGKLCKTQNVEDQNSIDVQNLISGVYLIIIKYGTETVTKKFVKL